MTRDADGFFQHVGRDDDLFKVAGMWVAPSEVEAVLLAHPGVAEAAVVGVPAEGGLLKPVAFVIGRGGDEPEALAEALTAHVEANLPPHQRLRRIAVVDELPRTVTGKLQRYVLREWAERTL